MGNPPCKAADSILSVTTAARSRHPGGVNVGMADGSVRFFKDSIAPVHLEGPEHDPRRRDRQQRRLLRGESDAPPIRDFGPYEYHHDQPTRRRHPRIPAAAGPIPPRSTSRVLAAECDFRTTRRSGPGGQNRNKVETAVILTHRPTGISAEAAERRTQGENRRQALFRLRLRLALEIRRPIDLVGPDRYRPSDLWRGRCRGGRIVVNPEHDDFPALLSEALDVLAATGHDPKRAAAQLECSPSQLVKFLKDEPRAFTLLNQGRQSAGLHPLQ